MRAATIPPIHVLTFGKANNNYHADAHPGRDAFSPGCDQALQPITWRTLTAFDELRQALICLVGTRQSIARRS
jgi:hypothetical protein